MFEPVTAAPDHLSIQQMRARFNVTARTLRFYEQSELLAPIRTNKGSRVYTKREIVRMDLIQKWQRFGFSLIEIFELLSLYRKGTANKEQQYAAIQLAKRKRPEIVRQRNELTRAIVEMDAFTVRIGI